VHAESHLTFVVTLASYCALAKNELPVAEAARLAQDEALRQRDIGLGGLLDHDQRMRLKPSALAQGFG
jgi:hypothetical protein